MNTFTIEPSGPFALRESVEFGFGQRDAEPFDGVMRLAFCLDGYREHAAVEVRQDERGVLSCRSFGSADTESVRAQVARILSLDVDAEQFLAIGERDPVIGELQSAAPGLRPPLFHSPYEAAVWAIIAARRSHVQAARTRNNMAVLWGGHFELTGHAIAALPLPEHLLAVEKMVGVPADRIPRLHAVARAAIAGDLDVARLRSLGPQEALADLQRLPGIGPFYAGLIVVRATGFVDVLPEHEPRLQDAVGRLYGLGRPAEQDELAAIAERWAPLRTWCAVLIRAASDRVALVSGSSG
ncbi:MAG TPA: hypothetical protein VIW24_02525 [Aldersonia sp.]